MRLDISLDFNKVNNFLNSINVNNNYCSLYYHLLSPLLKKDIHSKITLEKLLYQNLKNKGKK